MYHPLDESLIETKEIVSNEQNVLIDNLKSDTFYEIYLRGTNKHGEGENSKKIKVKTKSYPGMTLPLLVFFKSF